MKLGFWPQVYGNWIITDRPGVSDASFEYTRRCVLLAEELGFDTCLVAEHFFNPLNPHLDQLDAWSTCSALAALTSRIEIMAAVKAGLRAPGVIAKMASNIDEISDGRFAINLVSAWWEEEYEMMGASVLDRDTRYARSEEYLTICKGLWTENDFSFSGRHYSVKNATIAPKPVQKPHIPVYFGGESEEGRALAARMADIFLVNGRPPAEVGEIIEDMKLRAQAHERTLRFGIAAFVICRESEAAAEAEFDRLNELRHVQIKSKDEEVEKLKESAEAYRRVGSNGGTDAGLVGTPEQIAERMQEFAAVGVETFLLQFYPLMEELQRFGDEVMPLLSRD
jgi:alkanesulfonate monooxygenase SsuD/methylene tetrahydromethanopterin reductase-like flavin-dependent oxidoreductase (luciferase family)